MGGLRDAMENRTGAASCMAGGGWVHVCEGCVGPVFPPAGFKYSRPRLVLWDLTFCRGGWWWSGL